MEHLTVQANGAAFPLAPTGQSQPGRIKMTKGEAPALPPVSGATKKPYQRARKRQRDPGFNLTSQGYCGLRKQSGPVISRGKGNRAPENPGKWSAPLTRGWHEDLRRCRLLSILGLLLFGL